MTVSSVIDQFLHPPLRLMKQSTSSPSLLFNPYSGSGALVVSAGLASAYGLTWQVVTETPGIGFALGNLKYYVPRILQLVVYYQLIDGTFVPEIIRDEHGAQGLVLFESALPDHIDYWIWPGTEINFTWLVGASV